MQLPHLIICTDTNIGDSIMAMGAVQYIVAAKAPTPVYVDIAHKEVMHLMAPPTMRHLRDLRGQELMHVLKLDVGQALNDWHRDDHLLNSYLRQGGIRLDYIPQPTIDLPKFWNGERFVDADVPVYDYLFAPWSQDPKRAMQHEVAWRFADELSKWGSVCILGARGDVVLRDVHYHEYGRPLSDVVTMMRKARKAVITVDSGMNRLAHAADITNHLILHPDYLPEHWVGHPKATIVREPWNTTRILDALLEMENPDALRRTI